MSKRFTQQLLPAIIMAGAAAIPVVTTAAIINQSLTGSGAGATPAAPVAALSRSSGAGSGTTTNSAGHGTYQGPAVQQPYGAVQAAVTISNGKIADVAISAPQNNSMSSSINGQAVPLLRQETLQAQSANVNVISGATLTSQAYSRSLQGALAQAQQGGNAPAASQAGTSLAASGNTLSVHAKGDD